MKNINVNSNVVKKPGTLLAVQILLAFFGVPILIGLTISAVKVLYVCYFAIQNNEIAWSFFLVVIMALQILLPIFIAVVLVLLIAKIQKRNKWGRFTSMVVSIILLIIKITMILIPRPSGSIPYYSISNFGEHVGAMLFEFSFISLLIFLVLKVFFSKKIKQYYKSNSV